MNFITYVQGKRLVMLERWIDSITSRMVATFCPMSLTSAIFNILRYLKGIIEKRLLFSKNDHI